MNIKEQVILRVKSQPFQEFLSSINCKAQGLIDNLEATHEESFMEWHLMSDPGAIISGIFTWSMTKEGVDYWDNVHDRAVEKEDEEGYVNPIMPEDPVARNPALEEPILTETEIVAGDPIPMTEEVRYIRPKKVYVFHDDFEADTTLFYKLDDLMAHWLKLMKKDEKYMDTNNFGIYTKDIK